MLRHSVLIALGLALAACHKPPASPPPRHRGHVEISAVRPFPEAASVRLFVETGYDEKAHQSIYRDPKGRLLSPEQRRAYESLLQVQTPVNLSWDDDFFLMTSCFIPHHFFRYFDRAGRQMGEIAVCFCCSGAEVTQGPQLPLKNGQRFEANYAKLKTLLQSWGAPTNVMCGPSERGDSLS
jgi:hypothetical protein